MGKDHQQENGKINAIKYWLNGMVQLSLEVCYFSPMHATALFISRFA